MTDQQLSATSQIPNTETDSAPQDFRQVPTAAISAAVKASSTVKLVLNAAQITLAARADKFTQEVGVKAVQIAGERNAIAVDVPDVDKATEALYPEQPRSNNTWAWGILGIVAGALISFLVTALAPVIPEGGWKVFAVIVALVLLAVCVVWGVRLSLPKRSK